ncbi:hypothetical protein, partial [Streptomyces sp. URMC 123]|uniref:hypothetical protein n=1 Tax=Streptomyces sp. URMC 123 TaxID=3423403 RepID=UPI003F1AAA45
MNGTGEAGAIVRWRRGARALAVLAAVAVAGAACTHPLADKGPLPPRYSGPPIAADTVVAEMTSAFSAAGVVLQRQSQDWIGTECMESLSSEQPSATADAAVKDGFARARTAHGWQPEPPQGGDWLSLRKGNWTAWTSLGRAKATESPTTRVLIILRCDGGRSKRQVDTEPPEPETDPDFEDDPALAPPP